MEALIRAFLYFGTILLLGAGIFARWIGPELAVGSARRRTVTGAAVGAVCLIVGSLLEAASALARATGASEMSLLPTYLTETRHGSAILVRTVCVILILLAGVAGRRLARIDRAVFGALGLALLATFSLTSHAAGLQRSSAIAIDLLHLAAATAWGGALIYLAWLPVWPARGPASRPLTSAVRRVSQTGLLGVAALILTGVYASILHLWGLRALSETPYGHALLYKLGLVAVVLALAGINRWILVPGLGRAGRVAPLRGVVKVESLLLVAVLGLTGVLTSTPTPERPATVTSVTTFQEKVGPWIIQGTLAPRVPDGLELTFAMRDAQGNPPPSTLLPEAVLTVLDHQMDPITVRATRTNRAVFRATLALPMAGRWQVAIRLPDGVVRVGVQATIARSSAPEWRWPVSALGLLLGGVVLFGFSLSRRASGWRRRTRLLLAAAGTGAVVLAAFVFARAQSSVSSAQAMRDRSNPIAASRTSLVRGEEIYRAECQACHGVAGAGDGPGAAALDPRPADLRLHMGAGHTDGELFNWISEGMQGTAMAAFKGRFSEEDRWHVINFIRTLALTDR